MDDIVEEAGLSKGALYWYYKSKDAVILALMERVLDRELSQAEQLIESDGAAGERLQTFMRLALSDIAGLGRMLPLAYEFLAMASRRKAVRRAMADYYQKYSELLSEIIQQGIASGEFAELDVEQASLSLIALRDLGDAPMEALLNGFRARR
jgi:AcrR family transcriptional regulator